MPARGKTALYRPVPRDFVEQFTQLGWSSICEHYGAGWKTVMKWIEITGRQELRQARSEHVRRYGAAKSPARVDYVLRRVAKRQRKARSNTSSQEMRDA